MFNCDSLRVGNTSYILKIMEGIMDVLNLIFIGILNNYHNSELSLQSEILIHGRNIEFFIVEVPRQANGRDCGLALLENIERGIIEGDNFINKKYLMKFDAYSPLFLT